MMQDVPMRTTLTIEPAIAERLRQELALGKRPLKLIVNEALKRGLGLEEPIQQQPYRVTPHSSGFVPGIDVGKLNQLADEMEAGEFHRPRPGAQ
jgi:hypothetical protein